MLQILGYASFAIIAVPLARLHMRELQSQTVPLQILQAPLGKSIQLKPETVRELKFWANLTSPQATRAIHMEPPVHHLFTDASDQEWGAWWRDQVIHKKWPPQERHWLINEKELKAIYLAFKHYAKFFAGKFYNSQIKIKI